MKKFELTSESISFAKRKLFRIKALIDFGCVKTGDLGGFIEKEENLSQEGSAWVFSGARVYDNAQVYDNARVCNGAWVCGNARVYDNAQVYDNARVCGDARVSGNAWVCGDARVYNAVICNDADFFHITGLGTVHRTTTVFKSTDGVKVSCGCFFGTVAEFEQQVKDTRSGKVQAEYLKFVELIKIYFEEE